MENGVVVSMSFDLPTETSERHYIDDEMTIS